MGEISYRPLIEAMTWSYSRLEIFDDCPYRWFLTYIHTPKLKKEDKFYAAYGLFMHDLLEKYFKGENSKEEILMMFLTQFKAKTKGTGRPKAATVQKYFQSGTEFIKSLEPLRFKMISVEEKIDFKIGEFNFTGRIDYLGEEDGEFVIIDNKSRDLKPRSGRAKPTLKDKELDLMLRQLYIYAEAEEAQRIDEARKWLKTRKFTHLYIPMFDQQTIFTAVKRVQHTMGLDVLIVDYFKGSGDGDAFDSYQELGRFVDMVKNKICGDMGICGIGAAQATTTGKVADSAKIGRNASTIAIIQDKTAEEVEADGAECGNKKLRVILNRNGMQHASGEYIDLQFNGNLISYEQAKQHIPSTPY